MGGLGWPAGRVYFIARARDVPMVAAHPWVWKRPPIGERQVTRCPARSAAELFQRFM